MNTAPIAIGFTSGFVAALIATAVFAVRDPDVAWKLRVGVILLSGAVGGFTFATYVALKRM